MPRLRRERLDAIINSILSEISISVGSRFEASRVEYDVRAILLRELDWRTLSDIFEDLPEPPNGNPRLVILPPALHSIDGLPYRVSEVVLIAVNDSPTMVAAQLEEREGKPAKWRAVGKKPPRKFYEMSDVSGWMPVGQRPIQITTPDYSCGNYWGYRTRHAQSLAHNTMMQWVEYGRNQQGDLNEDRIAA